jgi:hypothetical protein
MRNKAVITALVAMLSCAAAAQSRPARYGWSPRPTEKFALSNRAKRRLPLEIVPAVGSDSVFINLQLTAQFPVNMSVQNARGDSVGNCRYADVTMLAANCSLHWDNSPRYIVVEDANQAELMEGAKGQNALNKVTLAISDYTCEKHCPKLQ